MALRNPGATADNGDMTRRRRFLWVGLLVAIGSATSGPSASARPAVNAATASSSDYSPGRHLASFTVAGVRRTAIVDVPADLSHPVPVVFAFHGHGGTGAWLERTVALRGLWPGAVVVYADGLPGHKGITDPQGLLSGWQTQAGELGNRDIAFYDTLLATLRSKLPVDADRVHLFGHSNGAAFASLLVSMRGATVAAVATVSAQPSAALLAASPARSMFMVMGQADPIVPYAIQKLSIPPAETKLGASPSRATVTGYLRVEPGRGGLELATYVHPGGHEIPAPVPALAVDFFRRHTLSGG